MQRQRCVWLTGLVASLMIVLSGAARAATTGKIVGTVVDASTGEPLPGANVIVEYIRLGSVTDANGRYFILNVPAGTHNLRVVLVGYAQVEVRDVVVRVGLTTTQDVRLEQEVIEVGQVTVTAERPLVQRDVTTSRTLVSREELTQRPIDNVQQAVAQTAGAVATFDGTFIRGGRSGTGEVAFYVDGVSLASPMARRGSAGTSDLATTLPRFSVEGMEVMRGSYTAEFGNAQSAIITVVTREGGSKHSGTLYTKFSPEALRLTDRQSDIISDKQANLDAWANRDWAAVDTTNAKAAYLNTVSGLSMMKYDRREVEASLGGPNPIASDFFPLSLFQNGNYFISASYLKTDGRWRGQASKDWAIRGKFTFRNTLGDKKFSITLHKQKGEFEGSGFFITADDGTVVEDWNSIVSTGDTIWVGDDGRPWWRHPSDPKAPYVVVDSLEGPNGEKVAVKNFDMRPNWAGISNEHSNEISMTYTHTITPTTYYEVNLSRFETGDYGDDTDPYERYVNGKIVPLTLTTQLQDRFFRRSIPILATYYQVSPNSVSMNLVDNNQIIYTARFDIESQFSQVHSGRRGFEFKYYNLRRVNSQPVSGDQVYHDDFDVNPIQMAGYIAEKFETQGMVLNLGARVDYLATRGIVPADPEQPVNLENQKTADNLGQYSKLPDWLKNPEPSKDQWYWSPRIGVSYPITEVSKMHFSYGHFYQFPNMYRYYRNMEHNMDGGWKYAGNPNLGPEKTILYEVGYEQQVRRMLHLSLTGFYKDIDGLIDMEERGTSVSTRYKYYQFVNSGYGNVRGFEFTFQNMRYWGLQMNVAYTFMIAKGRGGNERQGFLIAFNNQVPRTSDYPLEWDQRHTLQYTVDYRTPLEWGVLAGGWGANFQYTYGSGIPYSSSSRGINPPINDKRYPSTRNLDALFTKDISLRGATKVQFFFEVLNLTNRKNVLKVEDPERLEVSLREIARNVDIDGDGKVATEPNYAGRFQTPVSFSAGRSFRLGMQLDF